MEAINQRVGELVKALGMNPTSFAKSINKPQSSVAVIVDGRSKPGFEFLESICVNYPNLSRDWLMMGEGEMFRPTNKPEDGGAFGERVLTDMAKGLDEIRHVFEEELRAKNRQIDNLQEMLKMAMSSKTPEKSFSVGVPCSGRVVPLYPASEKAVA